jgi:2-amino-4-hydroxy-6-hydroxymethyldihydropteridine diphosphokinase
MTRAYVALGSNLGNRPEMLLAGLREIARAPGVKVRRVSRFVETEAVGPPQPRYLNAVCEVETEVGARALLAALLGAEARLGRTRDPATRNGPRTIDLDLLLYGDEVENGDALTLPHPRMHERRFVLEPLCDVAPDARHPVLGLTARELLDRLPRQLPPVL